MGNHPLPKQKVNYNIKLMSPRICSLTCCHSNYVPASDDTLVNDNFYMTWHLLFEDYTSLTLPVPPSVENCEHIWFRRIKIRNGRKLWTHLIHMNQDQKWKQGAICSQIPSVYANELRVHRSILYFYRVEIITISLNDVKKSSTLLQYFEWM